MSQKNIKIKPNKNDNISLEYFSELMENYFSESIVDVGKGLKALSVNDDQSIIFFINKEKRLCAVTALDGAEAGWQKFEISFSNDKVVAYDIDSNPTNNNFRISYAANNNGVSSLYVSQEINLQTTKFERFGTTVKWTKKELEDNQRIIDNIYMHNKGVLFSSSLEATDANYAHFKYGEEPKAHTLPEHSSKVKQLAAGKIWGEHGVFILYEIGNDQTMCFQSIVNDSGQISSERFSTGGKIEHFCVVPGEDDSDTLYLAGDGIARCTDIYDGIENIVPHQPGINFTKINASRNGEEVSLWTIGKKADNSGLYFLTNRYQEIKQNKIKTTVGENWTSPIQLYEHIDDFTSIKGKNLINQLFLFGKVHNSDEKGLIHFWQDKVTTQWLENIINVPALNEIKRLNTYTTHAQFACSNPNKIFFNENVSLSADSNIFVYVDDNKYLIGPDKKINVPVGPDGLHIAQPTDTIASPKIYVEADFLKHREEIITTHKVRTRLKEKIDSGDIKNPKGQDGKPLVTGSANLAMLNDLATKSSDILMLADGLDGNPNKNIQNVEAQFSASNAEIQGGFWQGVGHAMGSLWQSVKKGFIEITGFILRKVGQAVEVVINFGKKIYKWIAQKASELMGFLERMWEKVTMGFKKMMEYLGFLFKWKDIAHTKKVLKGFMLYFFDNMADGISMLQAKSNVFLDDCKTYLQKMEEEVFAKMNEKKANNFLETLNQEGRPKPDPRRTWINTKLRKSQGMDLSDAEKLSRTAARLKSDTTPFVERWKKILLPIYDDLKEKIPVFFENGMENIGDFFKYFFLKVAEIGIELARELINALANLIKKVVQTVKEILDYSIQIPFISDLLKEVFGFSFSFGFSLLDVFCYILAIPTTIGYKIAYNEAPFKGVDPAKTFDNAKPLFSLA